MTCPTSSHALCTFSLVCSRALCASWSKCSRVSYISYPTCSLLHVPRAIVHTVAPNVPQAPRALMLSVPCILHPVMSHVSHVVHALVPHVHRLPPHLVSHVSCVVCTLILYKTFYLIYHSASYLKYCIC